MIASRPSIRRGTLPSTGTREIGTLRTSHSELEAESFPQAGSGTAVTPSKLQAIFVVSLLLTYRSRSFADKILLAWHGRRR